MSLQTRLESLVAAIGADVKALQSSSGGSGGSDPDLPSAAGARAHNFVVATGAYNWKPSNTHRLTASIAETLKGSNNRWFVLGDSISANNPPTLTSGPSHLDMWPVVMRQLFQAYGVPVGGTGFVPAGGQPATSIAYIDPRWQIVSGVWTNNTSGYILGPTAAGTKTVQFVSDAAGDTFDLWYWDASGAFTVSIDGGAAVTPPLAGTGAYAKYTVTGLPNTQHQVTISGTSTTAIRILGARVSSTLGGLEIHNASVYGSTAGQWASSSVNSSAPASYKPVIDALGAPDAVFIELGGNDLNNSGFGQTSLDALKTNLTTIRNSYPNSDVIFILPHEGATFGDANYDLFQDLMYDLADSLDVALLDMRHAVGDYPTLVTDGLLLSDGAHLTPVGQRKLGQAVTAQVMTANPGGSPLTVPPAPITIVKAASVVQVPLSGYATVDGVAPSPGDAFLIKDQTDPTQNGVWVVPVNTQNGGIGPWVRHPAYDTPAKMAGAIIRVANGTYGAGTSWICSNKATDILGTTPIAWARVASFATYRTTAAVNNSTVTYATTGMSLPVLAGKNYRFEAYGQYQTAATTTGIGLRVNGTATMTASRTQMTIFGLTSTTYTAGAFSAFPAALLTTGVNTAANNYGWRIEGVIRVATSGTFVVEFASEVAGSSVTISPESILRIEEIQ